MTLSYNLDHQMLLICWIQLVSAGVWYVNVLVCSKWAHHRLMSKTNVQWCSHQMNSLEDDSHTLRTYRCLIVVKKLLIKMAFWVLSCSQDSFSHVFSWPSRPSRFSHAHCTQFMFRPSVPGQIVCRKFTEPRAPGSMIHDWCFLNIYLQVSRERAPRHGQTMFTTL